MAEVVQQGGLNGEPDRVVKGQLDNGEADLQVLSARGDCGAQYQRVGVGCGAVEVVLGQPHGVHAYLLGERYFVQGAVDDGRVFLGFVANGEDEGTKAHNCLIAMSLTGMWVNYRPERQSTPAAPASQVNGRG